MMLFCVSYFCCIQCLITIIESVEQNHTAIHIPVIFRTRNGTGIIHVLSDASCSGPKPPVPLYGTNDEHSGRPAGSPAVSIYKDEDVRRLRQKGQDQGSACAVLDEGASLRPVY